MKFPRLDEASLHDYRKRIKKVRYVAELSAAADATVGGQAVLLRKMQGAIGEWHDWYVLAEEASRTLRGQRKPESVTEVLENLAAESLQRALGLCRRSIVQLLKADSGDGHRSQPGGIAPEGVSAQERKPVAREALPDVVAEVPQAAKLG